MRASRISVPSGFTAAAAAGALVLVVAWWRGAPHATGQGAALTDAGRLSGLLAGYVAVLQLLLRARVVTIERGLGTDRINAAHRLLGDYLVLLVVAHGTLITTGYSRRLHMSLPRQASPIATAAVATASAMMMSAPITVTLRSPIAGCRVNGSTTDLGRSVFPDVARAAR